MSHLSAFAVLISAITLSACNQGKQEHQSMAPEGITSSPRPVGFHDTTVNRDGEPAGGRGDSQTSNGGGSGAATAGAGGRNG